MKTNDPLDRIPNRDMDSRRTCFEQGKAFVCMPATPKPSSMRNSAKCAEHRIRVPSPFRNAFSRQFNAELQCGQTFT